MAHSPHPIRTKRSFFSARSSEELRSSTPASSPSESMLCPVRGGGLKRLLGRWVFWSVLKRPLIFGRFFWTKVKAFLVFFLLVSVLKGLSFRDLFCFFGVSTRGDVCMFACLGRLFFACSLVCFCIWGFLGKSKLSGDCCFTPCWLGRLR